MDGLAGAVRQQLRLGRLLALGGPADGAWIAESAARAVLGRAATAVPGIRVDALRIALAAPAAAAEPVVPGPPSALPPGPLRVTARCAATADEPLPAVAQRLRSVLALAAHGLGLVVEAVDVRITEIVEALEVVEASDLATAGRDKAVRPRQASVEAVDAVAAEKAADATEAVDDPAARAALGVPGVTRLTGAAGGGVQVWERPSPGALAARHLRIDVATAAHVNALEVALAVRRAASGAHPDRPTVAVLVTDVDGLG
ncbi:hypothetical protein [Streptomyces indicus]|uniref:Nucleopolyhedrovirus P10 family protein n=1 Tax=Streptomyces indicus TaxID=417292 RepID=A0A1G9FCD1_9ACTN|nr:hypothetical protein [Streptomyces indicus]SDK85996.1 hypothetical protein SAMN05421806_11336 [Streptomyces indicus]